MDVDLAEFGRDLDILMTALNSNATSSLERVALASPSAAVEVDNGAKNDEDVKTPVADNTTKKNTRKKRKSSRKSEELDEKATAEPTSNGTFSSHFLVGCMAQW